LYELVTGARPFNGDSITELAYNVMVQPFQPPRAVEPAMPAHVERVILRALEKDPDKRFASIGEFAWALAGGGAPLATTSAQRIPRMFEQAGMRVESPSQLPGVPSTTGTSTAAPWATQGPLSIAEAPKPTSMRAIALAAGIGVLAAVALVVVVSIRSPA